MLDQRRLDSVRRQLGHPRRQHQARRIKIGGAVVLRRGLVDVGLCFGLQRRQLLRAPHSRLNSPHERAPIAHVGADKVSRLTRSAHESLGAGYGAARVVDGRIGPIADAAQRLPRREQYA